jgi:hypothetical protein
MTTTPRAQPSRLDLGWCELPGRQAQRANRDGALSPRRRREYLQFLDSAKAASELAVDSFNRVRNPYRNEGTLILLANAWELLAKSVLVQQHKPIVRGQRGETISAEVAVDRLKGLKVLDANQAGTIQQVISLRNEATHNVLPSIADEIMHHLLFYGCKFFREVLLAQFPAHGKDLPGGFISLSFVDSTTYADKVQKSVSKARQSGADRKLVWLLERGLAFDGSRYLTEKQVAAQFRGKQKIMPYLRLGDYVRTADMVRVVPVQAPRGYTADVTLRKGSAANSALPVVVRRTEIEDDYPFLTKEVGTAIGKDQNWTAHAAADLKLKGDAKFHQQIRASSSSSVQRYSQAAIERLKELLKANPTYTPYK